MNCCAACRGNTAPCSAGSTASGTSTACSRGLRGLPFESLVDRVMTGPEGALVQDTDGERALDASRELRNVLDFMLDDQLKARQSEAIAAVGTDPQALERYKALEIRRLELRRRLAPAAGDL